MALKVTELLKSMTSSTKVLELNDINDLSSLTSKLDGIEFDFSENYTIYKSLSALITAFGGIATNVPVLAPKPLSFKANEVDSTMQLKKVGSPDAISLEYFQNDAWHDYTIGSIISIPADSSIQMRAKTENATISKDGNYYQFAMTGSIAASGSIQYLLDPTGMRNDVPAYCYFYMFSGCTSLLAAPQLPATQLASSCYRCMFSNCTSLTTAPELPATQLADYCYQNMFYNCAKLSSIDVNFTTWSQSNATTDWVGNVASTGTFTCPEALPEVRGISNIPSRWTIVRK